MALTDKIVKIADKTRKLTGLTTKMTLDEIASNMDLIKANPILQDKSIEITENGTINITADEGFDGLNNVEVVTNVASNGGSSLPEKGIIVNEWNANGYATKLTVVGLTKFPNYYLSGDSASAKASVLSKYVQEIVLPSNVTDLGYSVCKGCAELTKINIPNTVTKVWNDSFNGCKKLVDFGKLFENLVDARQTSFSSCTSLNVKTMPSLEVTYQQAFTGCTGLVQLSLPKIKNMTYSGTFQSCSNLKAVWIGSSILSMHTGTFSSCSKLFKVYIDLPRETVEAMGGTSTMWGAKTGEYICNNDEGFMTKEQFDSIDWATYTG